MDSYIYLHSIGAHTGAQQPFQDIFMRYSTPITPSTGCDFLLATREIRLQKRQTTIFQQALFISRHMNFCGWWLYGLD